MWETCDTNLCSDKCKERIINSFNESNTEDCKDFTTSLDDGEKIKMQDDIKKVIIERLKYCKKIQNNEDGMESIHYTDIDDLKNKIILDIHKTAKLANLFKVFNYHFSHFFSI